MEILERSLTTQASAGRNHSRSEAPCDEKESCSKCTEGKCVWCGSMSSGTCHSSKGLCGPDNGYVESCPSVGANVSEVDARLEPAFSASLIRHTLRPPMPLLLTFVFTATARISVNDFIGATIHVSESLKSSHYCGRVKAVLFVCSG